MTTQRLGKGLLALTIACGLTGPAMAAEKNNAPVVKEQITSEQLQSINEDLKEKWGIEIQGIRLSAYDYMLDMRYRIHDVDAAKKLHGLAVKPYLEHPPSKSRLVVPFASKIGSLKQNSKTPVTGRTYVVMFANPGRILSRGDKVNLKFGNLSVDGIAIE